MKLSNFNYIKKVNGVHYGTVDVTTGFLCWKKTVTIQVVRKVGEIKYVYDEA